MLLARAPRWGCVLLVAYSIVSFRLAAVAQVAATTTAASPVAPVANPCPRFAAGSVVPQPQALFSKLGMLFVQFSYQTTTDAAGRTLFCFMTPAGLQNPTLHVNPGDHLIITVTNNTPAQPLTMALNPPNCGATNMGASSMNIHYHGTNTSPTCGSDEVIKTVINSGQTFQYNVAFPANEPPGLYWYHPHIHGIAEAAVLGGASGAIVVEGIQNIQPAVSGLRQRILMIRDQPQVQGLAEGAGGCVNGVPFQDITVNNVPIDSNQTGSGAVTFTPAVLHMLPGETQFWRVSNSSADSILDLQLQFDGVPQTIQLVAIDGVSVGSQDGTRSSSLIAATHFRLPPASRVEFLAKAPSGAVKLAQLVTTSINTGPDGDCDPTRPIFNIQVVSSPAQDQAQSDDRVPKFTALNTTGGRRFAGLAQAPIAQQRLVYFDEIQPTQFFMVVAGQPEQVFNPNAAPAIVATQGTVEEWTVENHAQENHEFHFHQLHFLVESQNNFEINGQQQAPADTGQYLDMIEVPGWDGNPNHPFPNVKLLIDFRGPDVGTFVFHCHILNHEDLGMMNIIQVVPPSSSRNSPSGAAPRNANQPDPTPAMTMNHGSTGRKSAGSMVISSTGGKM